MEKIKKRTKEDSFRKNFKKKREKCALLENKKRKFEVNISCTFAYS